MQLARTLTLFLLLALPSLAAARPTARLSGFAPTREPVSPAGVRASIDLPAALQLRNRGGSDGAGLCVFTSVEVAARWHSLHALDGLQTYMSRRPGGGYPEKLDAVLEAFCRQKKVPLPTYLQHTGGDSRFLELALKTRRAVAVTYSGEDDFYREPIAHMVILAHLDSTSAAILDNNRPGVWVWMSRREFLDRWQGADTGWAVVLIAPPPPPGIDPAPLDPVPPKRPLDRPRRPCPGPGPCPWREITYPGGVVEWKLYDADGRFLGQLQADGWHPAVGLDGWSVEPQGEPPVPPPTGDRVPTRGVDFSRIDGTCNRYWLNGAEVSEPAAVAAVLADGDSFSPLEDDSARYHLTLIARDSREAATLRALAAAAPGLDRVHLQVYLPTDWAARRLGPEEKILLQEPASKGGKRIFASPVTSADAIAEALQRSDPNWKPAPEPAPAPRPKNPDPPAPAPAPSCPDCPDCPRCRPKKPDAPAPSDRLPGWAIAAGTLAVLLRRREEV